MKFIPYGLQFIDDDDINAVIDILKSDWITTGPKIKEFEAAISAYIGCKYSVVVNSGTSALDIAVQSLDLPKDSEVITTPFTFVATSNSIIYNGLKPVFADICNDTFNINPEDARKKVTKNTRAIIYVDYAGQPCDIKAIKEIADEFDLYLIEDACHAIGAEYENRKVGNFADLSIFSFHPVKHITTGEGGAVVTNNKDFFEKLSLLRTHGIDKNTQDRFGPDASWAYDMKYLGRNYRMTDFQAALGISQLRKLENFIEERTKRAKIYQEFFEDKPLITAPTIRGNLRHVWHLYTILLDKKLDRNQLISKMRENNIGVNVHYIPVYKFSYYKDNFDIDAKDFPVTEDVFKRCVTLPLFVKLNFDDQNYVLNKLDELINYGRNI